MNEDKFKIESKLELEINEFGFNAKIIKKNGFYEQKCWSIEKIIGKVMRVK